MAHGFVTINKLNDQKRVIKYDHYRTEVEAQNRIVELHEMGLTDAFYVSEEDSTHNEHKVIIYPFCWTADPVAKTVTCDEEAINTLRHGKWLDRLRYKRNKYLEETDFYASNDRTLTDNMKTYRQDLRDLPANVDISKWPKITWPTKPED